MSTPESETPQPEQPEQRRELPPPAEPSTPPSDAVRREQAEEIVRQVQQRGSTIDASSALSLFNFLTDAISEVDEKDARRRVQALRDRHPDAGDDALVDMVVGQKCRETALIGAVTSSAALIPGFGTLASLTVGVAADIGATFKLQAELVLEIAAIYGHQLGEAEKQPAILLVTGLSAGSVHLAHATGRRVAQKVAERYTQKWVSHALPVLGVAASAGTNVLSTYIIGQRARAYFGRNPEQMTDWSDNLRAITGVDERRIGGWVTLQGQQSWATVNGFAETIGNTSRDAFGYAADQAGGLLGSVGEGLSSVGEGLSSVGGGLVAGAQATLTTASAVGDRIRGLVMRTDQPESDADAADNQELNANEPGAADAAPDDPDSPIENDEH